MEDSKGNKAVRVFAKNLAELRKGRQLTQSELAEHVGLSRGVIGYYESNTKNPTLKTLYRFAQFFGVPVSYLIEEHNGKKKNGPPSRLEQQVERIKQLSPVKQRMVGDILEATLNAK